MNTIGRSGLTPAGVAFLILVAALLLAAASTGCVRTRVEVPLQSGTAKFERLAILNKTTASNIQVRTAGADPGVTIDGYSNEQTELAAKALETAAAALRARKP